MIKISFPIVLVSLECVFLHSSSARYERKKKTTRSSTFKTVSYIDVKHMEKIIVKYVRITYDTTDCDTNNDWFDTLILDVLDQLPQMHITPFITYYIGVRMHLADICPALRRSFEKCYADILTSAAAVRSPTRDASLRVPQLHFHALVSKPMPSAPSSIVPSKKDFGKCVLKKNQTTITYSVRLDQKEKISTDNPIDRISNIHWRWENEALALVIPLLSAPAMDIR